MKTKPLAQMLAPGWVASHPGRLDLSPPAELARQRKDRLAGATLLVATALPLAILVLIIAALLLRARPILALKPLGELLTSQTWRPLQGEFGFYPFIAGTFWVTGVAMVLAVPPCLLTAIYLSEYARAATRNLVKPLLDLLAAIPSVVYGVWGILVIVPFVQETISPLLGRWLGFLPLFATTNPTGYSILAGGVVLAVMIAPFIIAVSYEVLQTVSSDLRQASLAVGATQWQTIKYAVIPQVLPGIAAGIVMGASRALGETMAVLMVVGNVLSIPSSIFDPAYPLPALIANNYGEMMSIPLYDSALMLAALLLLVIVLAFNAVSALVLRGLTRRLAR